MQHYCGAMKSDELLQTGLQILAQLEENEAENLMAGNPRVLVHALEVQHVLTVATLVMHACLARKASSRELHFERLDYPEMDPPEWRKLITVANDKGLVKVGEMSIDYYGDLAAEYERVNRELV